MTAYELKNIAILKKELILDVFCGVLVGMRLNNSVLEEREVFYKCILVQIGGLLI